MYATNYQKASSLDDAVAKLQAAEDGKFLAGGQTLLATMKQRLAAPDTLVDLTKIPELKGIKVEGGALVIGAACTHSEVASSDEVAKAIPALAGLAATIGDPAVRNMGTLGGVVANNDPAADYPAAVMGLDAVVHTTKGSYTPQDYFQGMFETALDEDEIITRVAFQIPQKAAYEKFRNPASRYSLCSVFAAVNASGEPRIAVTGSGAEGVFRVTEMEEALKTNWSPDAVKNIKVSPDQMLSDIHGSAEYRAHLVTVLAARAVEKAG
jgi:carbon-monoxide dehydrogenase medium subunit